MSKLISEDLEFNQERRMIDAIPGGAGDLHNDFREDIRNCFSDNEAHTGIQDRTIEIDEFNHIPKHIMDSFIINRSETIDGDTATIEVSIQGQLFALLYDRRDMFNHSEIIHFINKRLIENRRNYAYILDQKRQIINYIETLELHHIPACTEVSREEIHHEFLEKVKALHIDTKEKFLDAVLDIKYLYHIAEDFLHDYTKKRTHPVERDRFTIEITINDALVALLYEKKDKQNISEINYYISQEMIKRQEQRVLNRKYKNRYY